MTVHELCLTRPHTTRLAGSHTTERPSTLQQLLQLVTTVWARRGGAVQRDGAGAGASAQRWRCSARCISRPAGEMQCGSSSEPVEEAVGAGEAELVPAAAIGPARGGRGGET